MTLLPGRPNGLRTVLAASTVLCLLGILEGASRGLGPARLATLNLLALLGPLLLLIAIWRRFLPPEPAAEGIAAGFLLYVWGVNAAWLHETWVVFSLRPRGLAMLALLAALTVVAFLLLRPLLARVTRLAPARWHRPLSIAAGAFVVAVVPLSIFPRASAPAPAAPPPADRPNVILLSIETLRADHLSAYGYAVHRTPALDRIAAEGARFDAAYAPAPWTLATLSSMMTGYYPSVLGVTRRRGMPPGFPTLAARFAEAGYTTHAIVTNVFLSRSFRLDSGFASYDHLNDVGLFDDLEKAPLYHFLQKVKLKLLGNDAGRLTRVALRWVAARHSSRPFFLWLHYYDPHQPYGGRHVRDDLPCGSKEAPGIGYLFTDARRVIHHQRTLTESEQRHLVHLYDAEIRFLDRELGRLFAFLDESGLGKDTLLVVTADHGEEFWDHGGFEHGHSLHREVTRVPLLVRWPGRVSPGTVVDEPVSLIDLVPTLVSAAGLSPLESQGVSLPGLGVASDARPVLSENILYGPEQKAARDASLSLIFSTERHEAAVYDRLADAAESTPIDSARGAPLLDFLNSQVARNGELQRQLEANGSVELTDFQREQLRALGYVD